MPRDLPLGNGRLLLCFDNAYAIRDLYFPHVGQENHVSGNACRLGVWVDNRFSWVGGEWRPDLRYQEDTLVTEVVLLHEEMGILIRCRDAVDFHENIYIRLLEVENLRPRQREVRLFFSQDFDISGNSVGDTAAWDPKAGAVVHYKGPRYFLAGASRGNGNGIEQFAVGQKGGRDREGTYRDAEDGILSGNTIAQGSVDSVLALHLTIEAVSGAEAAYWLCAGESWEEVRRLDALVKRKGPATLLDRTAAYWHLWVHKETPALEILPERLNRAYRRGLLVLSTQIDWQGGILAANDSDVILFNRDTYSYIWPRDGALVAGALDLAGYPALSRNFFRFAARVVHPDGYFLHKYNPDSTLASSWHPWSMGGRDQLPIQEDETALVLWALWRHFVLYRDIEFLKPLYRPLIKNCADFMCGYRDPATGLPLPSYDLWEERQGILSFTAGAVFGGLTAASLFCQIFGEEDKATKYRRAAAEIRDAVSTHLWREDLGRFCRMVTLEADGRVEVDPTCDASLWGLFNFGMYEAGDPRIAATMRELHRTLWLRTPVGGMARYSGDGYHRVSTDYPGNPWFICTMWYADYLIDRAAREEELEEPRRILEWVADHALPSGVLAEQLHPESGAPLSVSPLTWSHATFVASSQRLLRRLTGMRRCPECGLSLVERANREDWLERLYQEACDSIHHICRVK